jgi:hypothetical protein
MGHLLSRDDKNDDRDHVTNDAQPVKDRLFLFPKINQGCYRAFSIFEIIALSLSTTTLLLRSPGLLRFRTIVHHVRSRLLVRPL